MYVYVNLSSYDAKMTPKLVLLILVDIFCIIGWCLILKAKIFQSALRSKPLERSTNLKMTEACEERAKNLH